MSYSDLSAIKEGYSLIPKEIYFENWKKYYQDYHSHWEGCLEVDYIVDGSCVYHIDEKEVCLAKHSLLIHNGANPHDYQVKGSCLNMSILFGQEKIPFSAGSLSSLLEIHPYLTGVLKKAKSGLVLHKASSLYHLLKEINNSYSRSSETYYLNLLSNKLLIDLVNAAYLQSPSRQYTEQIQKYVEYNYFKIESLDDIAKALSLNKIYMQRIFKEETGETIWNFVNEVRMKRAAAVLAGSDVPVGDINEVVGVNSRQNFYILFKKYFGISPSEYRKSRR